MWVGLVWARYFAPSLPTAAAAAAPGEAPGSARGPSPASAVGLGQRRGRPRRWRGSPGPRSQPLVHPPRPPLRPRQPTAKRRRPWPRPRRGALGLRSQPAVRLEPAPGAAGLAAWAAGAVSSAGAGPWVDGPVSAEAARGCLAGGPTGTAASASFRSARSSGVSPAHSRETGERERDRRWWWSSRWGEPSESDITVVLVGMRGGRCALLTTSGCIGVVPWAVLCSAPRGEGVGGRWWRQACTGGGRWPSIGTGRGGGGATRPTRRATAPSLGRGSGPWAPRGRRVVPGGAALG